MSPEQREQVNELCRRIQVEPDSKQLSSLLEELDRLLEQKENSPVVGEHGFQRSA